MPPPRRGDVWTIDVRLTATAFIQAATEKEARDRAASLFGTWDSPQPVQLAALPEDVELDATLTARGSARRAYCHPVKLEPNP